ncbi:MAG: nickel-dependent hydrogenase large subunit [Candidatus Aminicenantes bacterium]|nr:MAG: nickel-dependent hydrogenase large subunit [Candidatus Aminicenantes bacterium]
MKRISVDLLARVEGKGGISAAIDGNIVTDVKFSIFEGPRLVERLTIGKTPEEGVNIAPRICAICSISHKYAAIRAMENALSVKVPAKISLLRELMHMGEMIESHSLHLYYLALPDYVGFPNAIAMASKFDLEVKIALEMKEFGNHIMKTASGRFIHGENPVIGGFGKFPSLEELIWIKSRAIQFMPFVLKTATLFCELDYPRCPEDDTVYVCCNPAQNKYGLAGDKIILSTREIINKEDYKSLTNEFVVSHSFAKSSRYKGKSYSVGALARINNLGERLEGKAGKMYQKYFNSHWKRNPLLNNAAQALEILFCFESIPKIVDKLIKCPEDSPIVDYTAKEGKGTGIVEAPRGLLIHHYEINNGLVSNTDIITPTAQNAEDIEKYCHIAAQKLLYRGEENNIRDRMALVVRAYDPCFSCSSHMAEVKKAPSEDWKTKLASLKKEGSPIFIGLGKRNRSDDQVGMKLALELMKHGVKDVFLESELERKKALWKKNMDRPFIFFDALDFREKPGKVTLLPLQYVLSNCTLSHRMSPFISQRLNYKQLKNSFVLGIQPETVKEGRKVSIFARQALVEVFKQIVE